jgi:ATP synthase subunit C.
MNPTIISILFFIALFPLVLAFKSKKIKNKKIALYSNIILSFALCILTCVIMMASTITAAEPADGEVIASESKLANVSLGAGLGMLGVALVTGLSCIGAGIAVAASASSAIGAISENPKTFGKAMIFVALAEGVALYGLLISIQILSLFN